MFTQQHSLPVSPQGKPQVTARVHFPTTNRRRELTEGMPREVLDVESGLRVGLRITR